MRMSDYDIAAIEDEEDLRRILVNRIARNIRTIRRKKGLTQEEVAERAGNLSVKYYSEIERQIKKRPSGDVLFRIAKALSVPICELVSDDCCPYGHDGLPQRLAKLMSGKPERDCKKAMQVIEIILGK